MHDLALNRTSWCYRAVGQKPCPEFKRVQAPHWDFYGDMEKKMETTGIIGVIEGLYRDCGVYIAHVSTWTLLP